MLDRVKDYIKDEEFRMTIFKNRVHIVNYQEVLSLEPSRVSVQIENKRMILKGTKLIVKKLLDHEILIQGEIHSVEWEK